MFYCDPCKEERRYPGIFPTSHGKCEICGKSAPCYVVPSSMLPKAEKAPIDNNSPERRHAVAETPGDGPYDKRDRGKMVKPEPGAPAGGYLGSLEQMGYPASPPPVDLSQVAKVLQPTPAPDVERIVAAAIQIEGVTISLPRPARHGTVLAAADWYLKTQPGQEVQGFLTSTGRFVNRIQARHIADIAGQKPGRSGGRDNPELYSEDLW